MTQTQITSGYRLHSCENFVPLNNSNQLKNCKATEALPFKTAGSPEHASIDSSFLIILNSLHESLKGLNCVPGVF